MKRNNFKIPIVLIIAAFTLIQCAPSVSRRIDKVNKTGDQTRLAKIAVEDEYNKVREAAVEKLTDQAILPWRKTTSTADSLILMMLA